jgi:hypothetical protein
MNVWNAVVTRHRKKKGPGKFILYKNFQIFAGWECITGGNQTDPTEYGGLTPPINWIMIEPIRERKHPSIKRGGEPLVLDMARIIPVGIGASVYSRRTYGIDRDPFMIHPAGSSTGCIAIDRLVWDEAKTVLNNAWREDRFLIRVDG